MLIVLAAFAIQLGVVLLAFHMGRPAPASAAAQTANQSGAPAPADTPHLVDLGTYNITQFQPGDPLNRRQLAVALAISVEKTKADKHRKKILDQRVWIGQLLDELIGPLPMDAVHPSKRERLKEQVRAHINKRLGEEVAREIILRIQIFGP